MFFPIGDDQVKGGARPIFSYSFLLLNILVFLYQLSLSSPELNAFIFHFGAVPSEITSGDNYFSLFTSMFLHGGWFHLIGNMMFLWVFADNIEANLGNWRFLLYYLLGGLAAHALHIYFYPQDPIPTVGASGAISAVLGTYLVLFPFSRIKILFILLLTYFRIPALLFLLIWFGQQLFYGYTSLNASESTNNVAWMAHIGGFAFGLLAGFLIRSLIPRRGRLYRPK